MRKSKYSDSKIISILKEAEEGTPVSDCFTPSFSLSYESDIVPK